MNTKEIKLEATPPEFIAFAVRRVTPFARAWVFSEELDLLFLLASVYAQGVRDAERVAEYQERKKVRR
jgi:hypothetical protein